MSSEEFAEFPTFNGMSRKAMFAGAPLMPTITLFGITVVIGLVSMGKFGAPGIATFLLFLPFFMWMRTMTEDDDQAIDVIGLELYCLLFKSNTALFPRSTSLNHTKIGRAKYVYQSYFTTIQKH